MDELHEERADIEKLSDLDEQSTRDLDIAKVPIREFEDIDDQIGRLEQSKSLDNVDGVAVAVDDWIEVNRSRWANLDETGRRLALTNLERSCAGLQGGRSPAEIRIEDLSSGPDRAGLEVAGVYSPDVDAIVVHDGLSFDESVLTVVHEGRHAYQNWAVEFDTGDPRGSEWAENFRDYRSAHEDIEEYRTQPLEEDAWSYEESVATRLKERHG